jgi:hypothetical protein
VLQSLAEPLKAMDGQMPNAPRKAGIMRIRLHFAPCPAKKSSPFADNL